MAKFIDALGRPDQSYPIIHIAGTNGKGSTAAMLEQVFRSAGFRTGLFTSPHLVFLGERIHVNRKMISKEEINELVKELDLQAKGISKDNWDDHPTFFEFMTGMALLYFYRREVDVGIVETGLGGRLDATNVLDPVLSIITSISLDHTRILGDTVEKIAEEVATEYLSKYYRSVIRHYDFDGSHWGETEGYQAYQAGASAIQEVGLDAACQGFVESQAWGTPDQIIEAWTKRAEMTGDLRPAMAVSYAGMPFEMVRNSLKLIGAEVAPALRKVT